MAPFYKGWDPKLKLEKDDIKGIQALYGPPSLSGGTPVRSTSARPSTTASPGNPDKLCDAEIDAMVQTADGKSYVFQNREYWKLAKDGVAPGYPKLISDDWPGLPSYLDAAITMSSSGNTFFFKGDQYWKFDNQVPSPKYPKNVSLWGNLPRNIDAALEDYTGSDIYFFKGYQVWKFDDFTHKIPSSYPKDLPSDFPTYMDAAIKWSNGKTYVFRDGNYWRLDQRNQSVEQVDPPYPRDTGKYWFGCSRKSLPLKDGT